MVVSVRGYVGPLAQYVRWAPFRYVKYLRSVELGSVSGSVSALSIRVPLRRLCLYVPQEGGHPALFGPKMYVLVQKVGGSASHVSMWSQ